MGHQYKQMDNVADGVGMKRFLTFDFNGWLDYIVDQNDDARSLGFRSCLHKHEDQWLMGAQALSAARYKNSFSHSTTVDAVTALRCSAELENNLTEWDGKSPLPSALWKSIEEASRRTDDSINLAIVLPDDKILGSSKVSEISGVTQLETLHNSFHEARPIKLIRSRIELIWRSVAVVQAALCKGYLNDFVGHVLVISVNERITWRVMELRRWRRPSEDEEKIRIVRSPFTGNRDDYTQSGVCLWMENYSSLDKHFLNSADADQFRKSTRWVEILATDASAKTIENIGINPNAIEHRSWGKGVNERSQWTIVPPDFPFDFGSTQFIQEKLLGIIEKFPVHEFDYPLPIIIENPVGDDVAKKIQPFSRKFDRMIEFFTVSGSETAEAASSLAKILGEANHPNGPAWLDSVPEIQLEVRNKLANHGENGDTRWVKVVSGNDAIPAGEIYSSTLDKNRRITLAPGIEEVYLHFRRGDEHEGGFTRHSIEPSDYEKVVEPIARVRPLSSEVRIEFVEHLPGDKVMNLTAETVSIKWQNLLKERPLKLGSIPELYIYRASCEGWKKLEGVLTKIQSSNIPLSLLDEFHKITNEQWKDYIFPLGSDGQPPRDCGENPDNANTLLRTATGYLLANFDSSIYSRSRLNNYHANRLHMGLTWLFTGCPDDVVQTLLTAILEPNGAVGHRLHMDKEYSEWSIYSGVGRAVQNETSLRQIYDTLIKIWEDKGAQEQDKFLLAAVSHPLARRVAARRVLCEDISRFQRVRGFLDRQLDNLINGDFDCRPGGIPRPSMELRYLLMGYRGLCQVRWRHLDWFPVDTDGTKEIYSKFMRIRNSKSIENIPFERRLLELTVPYLIGKGRDPTMPAGF